MAIGRKEIRIQKSEFESIHFIVEIHSCFKSEHSQVQNTKIGQER